MDIWKRYYLQNQKNIKNLDDALNNINKEDKNAVISKIDETRNFLRYNMDFFCIDSNEKLRIFLEKYDKMENEKRNNFVGAMLKKENDKYMQNSLKNSDKFTINANLNMKINRYDIYQIQKDQNNYNNNIINNKKENEANINNIEKMPNNHIPYKRNMNININNINNNIDNNLEQDINKIAINNNNNINNFNNMGQINTAQNIYQANNYDYNYNDYQYNKTYENWNNNDRYRIPNNNYNGKIVKTPEKNANVNRYYNINNQNNYNPQVYHQYTGRQINPYKNFYDNENDF